jgi:hypothetical protein
MAAPFFLHAIPAQVQQGQYARCRSCSGRGGLVEPTVTVTATRKLSHPLDMPLLLLLLLLQYPVQCSAVTLNSSSALFLSYIRMNSREFVVILQFLFFMLKLLEIGSNNVLLRWVWQRSES